MNEFAGRLRERVRIEQRVEGQTSTGSLPDQWSLVAERWAEVVPVSGAPSTEVASDTWLTARQWRITIRSGLALALPLRVVWRDRILKIIGIDGDPGRRGRTVIAAEEWGP